MDNNTERRRFKARRDFIASRNILRANIHLFDEGHTDVYRVVAVELRKLLCDGKATLIPRLFPNARLHPTRLYQSGVNLDRMVFQIPAHMEFDGKGGVKIVEVFSKRRVPIPLDEWLRQPLLDSEITLRNFLRSVADKESAHADEDFNETLLKAMGISLGKVELIPSFVVAIGRYVLELVDLAVTQNPHVFGSSADQ